MACTATTHAHPVSNRGSGGRAPSAGAHPTAAAARPAPAAGPRGRPFGSSRFYSGSAGAPASILSGASALRLAAPAAPRTGAAAGRRAFVAAAAAGLNGSTNGSGHGSAGLNGNGSASSGPAAVEHFDFIVLGSGIAGLSYALKVAQYGRVAVITKAAADEGCTAYAQVWGWVGVGCWSELGRREEQGLVRWPRRQQHAHPSACQRSGDPSSLAPVEPLGTLACSAFRACFFTQPWPAAPCSNRRAASARCSTRTTLWRPMCTTPWWRVPGSTIASEQTEGVRGPFKGGWGAGCVGRWGTCVPSTARSLPYLLPALVLPQHVPPLLTPASCNPPLHSLPLTPVCPAACCSPAARWMWCAARAPATCWSWPSLGRRCDYDVLSSIAVGLSR